MILLPDGFDSALLFAVFFFAAAPFIGISFLIDCGLLIVNYLNSIDLH